MATKEQRAIPTLHTGGRVKWLHRLSTDFICLWILVNVIQTLRCTSTEHLDARKLCANKL